ncbi:hypothetical protein O181_084948 [Austropuccinia psidii MF-1]|uniref:Protein-S-isoprenylcysteine O-methyltransferase n=1 Tax=Austropuccinia psidii MF-1 TaxID=1389203 RepID=A0A9Q3FWK0_9BASI|nr:hypothetical protein [Austropuccinia psidii MF-1]
MPENLQTFQAHPRLFEDNHKPSANQPHSTLNSRSWPLISFDNTIQNVCCFSFLLGCSFCANLLMLLLHRNGKWNRLNIYLISLSLFHLFEFLTTAIWNPTRVTIDSFLFNNGSSYWFSQLFCLLEHIITQTYFPSNNSPFNQTIKTVGLTILIFSQTIRTLAMITAAQSFNHRVSDHLQKLDDHVLVTNGIYRFFRHPSYFGFFWWTLGIQIYLQNWISLTAFSFILWKFFYHRIQGEEKHLIRFFQQAYLDYKQTTPTGIPFIK